MQGRQSFAGTPSNGGDRELVELRRELDETKFAKERLEIELRSVRETSENRKRALNDALSKLQEKKQQIEKQTQELNKKAEEIDNTNQKCEEIKATLMQKESALRGANSSHEQLRARFNEMQKNMENENRDLSRALDDANSKCEEQERGMKKYVGDIENLKSVIANLQRKCSNSEATAEENKNKMRQMELEIESKGATLAVFSENKSHYDVLKMKLAECERNLQQEITQRVLAERELKEVKSRDGHLLKVEKEHNTVREQLKWRNEQFGLLEEAYKKLQKEFQDGKDEWEREKVGIISEISTLQANLETQSRLSKDLQSQLQRCNQTLAHEESRRKVLEIQVKESQHGFEKVTAEIDEARSVIESMTEKYGRQVGIMRDSLDFKERHIHEMEIKRIHMEQENQELRNIVEELQASKSRSEEVCSSLERLKMKYTTMEEAYIECCETLKIKESKWEKERDDMLQTLNDCQTDLLLKDGKLYELQSQLEGACESAERSTCQKAELSQQLLILESQYQEAQSKLSAENLNLESLYKRKNEEVVYLKEQLEAKQKAFEKIQQDLTQHQITIKTMSAQCESLEILEKQLSVMREDLKRKQEQVQSLSKSQCILQEQIRQKEQAHIEEVRKVREALEEASACLCAKEQVENEHQNQLRRLQETIERTQAACAASEVKAEEYQNQLQALQQELLAATHALTLSEKKNKTDKESLLDAIKVRDCKIEELKDQIVHFEQSLNGLNQQEETWVQLQSHYKQLSDLRTRELESLSVANAKLESISKQLLDKEQERDLLQKCIESKEVDLGELNKESKILMAEKKAIIDSIKMQEEKYKKLTEENEQIKLALQETCIKLEATNSELTDRDNNITELQEKIKHGTVLHQELSDAENKIQCLEGLLEEARSCLQDKEDQISEFEITVEQFRNEILVAKLQLAEKEKDEAIVVWKLRDADNELRSKEDQLLEMDSKLNSILRESEAKESEILCLRDEIKEIEKSLCESEERHADMEGQMKSVTVIVEEKVAALNAAELEVQRERNALEDTKDVIEQLKFQLSNEEKTSFDRQSEIEHLYNDLERTKIAERQALESLKEVQGGLEQLEQDSEDQISKLQGSITELQYELSGTHTKMENIDRALKCANGELALSNEKCIALEHMLSNKDEALQAKERELSSLQTDISQQAEIIGKGQLDLQLLQDRLRGEFEGRENLEKTVSLFRHQVAELHERNQELENMLNSINQDYEAALKTVNDRDACISLLEENSRVFECQLEEFNVASGNHERIISELLQKLKLYEDRIEVLEKQAFGLHGALEEAVDSLKEETNEVSYLYHSFDELKTQLADIKMDTVSALKEGMRYVAEFRDVIKVLDNFQLHLEKLRKRENVLAASLVSLEESKSGSSVQAKEIDLLTKTVKNLDSQLLEWKDKAFNSAEVAEHMRSELENANQVISNFQRQLAGCKSIQDASKDVETSIISSIHIDVLKRDLAIGKSIAMSDTEETKHSGLKLKLSRDSVTELSSNMEGHENREHHMDKHYFLLENEILDSLLGLSDEMDKFSLFCNSTGEQEGEVKKFRQEMLLKLRELKAMLSSVKDQLKSFMSLKGQVQSYDMKLETMEGQLSDLRSDIDKEREKANHYAKSMEVAKIDLAIWKDKVDCIDSQIKALQSEVEVLNRSVDELRKQKEEVMGSKSQLQDERTAKQGTLQNMNSNFVEETGRYNFLSLSIQNMEEEKNNLLEKMRSITEENKSTKLKLEAAKMELSQLSLHVSAGEDFRNLEEMNQKLKHELTAAHEEIQSRKDFVQKFLCELRNVQVQDISHQERFQAILNKIFKKWDMEGTMVVYPMEDSINEGTARNVVDDFKISYASWLPSDKIAQSQDENATGEVEVQHLIKDSIETKRDLSLIDKDTETQNHDFKLYNDRNHLHVCDAWQKIQGEQPEEKVRVLVKELETALVTLAGKNAAIENLNREVKNMQALVKRLEQRSSQLEQYKDLSTIEPERYFHYVDLCDSLIRDQLRLKKKLETVERKNQVLVDQLEEFRQSTQARTSLKETLKNTALNEKQDENSLCTPKASLLTDVVSGHGSAERSPLQVLNC